MGHTLTQIMFNVKAYKQLTRTEVAHGDQEVAMSGTLWSVCHDVLLSKVDIWDEVCECRNNDQRRQAGFVCDSVMTQRMAG